MVIILRECAGELLTDDGDNDERSSTRSLSRPPPTGSAGFIFKKKRKTYVCWICSLLSINSIFICRHKSRKPVSLFYFFFYGPSAPTRRQQLALQRSGAARTWPPVDGRHFPTASFRPTRCRKPRISANTCSDVPVDRPMLGRNRKKIITILFTIFYVHFSPLFYITIKVKRVTIFITFYAPSGLPPPPNFSRDFLYSFR